MSEDLATAVASGQLEAAAAALDAGADPDALDAHGLGALHVAAACGSPLVEVFNRAPLDVPLVQLPDAPAPATWKALVELLVDRGARVDLRATPSGATALHVARYFGRGAIADVLVAHGADVHARDTLGRTAEQLAVFPSIGRAVRTCERLPMVRAAHVAQMFVPHTHQLTSPALGLDLASPLPPDAFAAWPSDAPLVVFALGDDAISRLVRLAPAVYVAPIEEAPLLASGRGIAAAIADAIDARAIDLPSRDHTVQLAVVRPDGGAPVLVRDFGHAFGVAVGDARSWTMLATADPSAIIGDVAAEARAWSTAHPDQPTLVEIALGLATALAAETGERWTIGIPGTPEPSEMWLAGAQADAAAVGVFAGAVRVWLHGNSRTTPIASRAALADAVAPVLAGVRAQQQAYAQHLAFGERMRAFATALAEQLRGHAGKPVAATARGFTTYENTITMALGWDGVDHVTLDVAGETIRVHAGLPGDDGWRHDLADGDLASALAEPIAMAIATAAATLTIERLTAGARYAVIADIQDLVAGTTVTYRGYDDVDNHFGRYVFVDDHGVERVVCGDCSNERRGPLGQVHRFLRIA